MDTEEKEKAGLKKVEENRRLRKEEKDLRKEERIRGE